MLRKILIITLAILGPLHYVPNGYHQETKIIINGIDDTCYGTLLSSKTVSGYWSSQMELDLNAPEDVKEFFKNYKDDKCHYLNYFQDVSEGLLHWFSFPPEEFKLLLYFPNTKTYYISDKVESRYALNSAYIANIENGVIHLTRNYDYPQLIKITLLRIIIGIVVSIAVALLYSKPDNRYKKDIYTTNIIFHIILNILISIYSIKNGFGMFEYLGFTWIPYILFFIFQGHIYSNQYNVIHSPYFTSLYSNIATYALGMFLVDVFPRLFTIIQ